LKRYVYLLQTSESGTYKIGISKNPEKRVKELQTGNPEIITIKEKFLTEYYFNIETSLHGYYAPDHKRGEWFNLGLLQEMDFINRCKQFEEYYKLVNSTDDLL
jgi:hypothetical protein